MTLIEKRIRRREKDIASFRHSIETQVFNLKSSGQRISALKLIRTALDFTFSDAVIFYNQTPVSNSSNV